MRTNLAAACFVVGLASCGLSVVGVASQDAGGADGGSGNILTDAGDSTPDANAPAAMCDSGAVSAGLVVLPDGAAACPPGTTEKTVHTAPQATDGACSCGACTPKTDPTCAGPDLTWRWGGDNGCNAGPSKFNITADNACIPLFTNKTTIDVYNRWTRTPTGGSCTASTVADPTKVSTTSVRQCVPNDSSAVCDVLAGHERMCVPSSGNSCHGRFSVPLVVGDGATVTCADCGCTRAATACNVEYHDNTSCTNKLYERLADGQCVKTGQPNMLTIKVYPVSPTCTATAGAPTAALTNSMTLCCTP